MLQILHLAHNKSEIERRVHAVIDKFAERGLRSLAVAYQVNIFIMIFGSLYELQWCMNGLILVVLFIHGTFSVA